MVKRIIPYDDPSPIKYPLGVAYNPLINQAFISTDEGANPSVSTHTQYQYYNIYPDVPLNSFYQ